MNKNSQPSQLAIKKWLKQAAATLDTAGVNSARLDAELILSDALGATRTWLAAHDDEQIPEAAQKQADNWLQRRAKREPLAYIRGWVEFYGHKFNVDKHVLIPRPETEEIIELLKPLKLPQNPILIDVGTGSGCVAISAKLTRPELEVHVTDVSESALTVARQNVKNLDTEVTFHKADLLPSSIVQRPTSIITANLPYVDLHFTVTPEANTEPALALYADNDGYELIEKLLPQAAKHLASNGYLILESDPWQQERIIKAAQNYGLHLTEQKPFHLLLRKVTN